MLCTVQEIWHMYQTRANHSFPEIDLNSAPNFQLRKEYPSMQYVSICFIMFHALLLEAQELSRPSTHVQQLHLGHAFRELFGRDAEGLLLSNLRWVSGRQGGYGALPKNPRNDHQGVPFVEAK